MPDFTWNTMQANWWMNNPLFWQMHRRHHINDADLDLVTLGTDTPITLDDAKDQVNVEDTSWDTYLTGLIIAASAASERYTGRSIVGSTWDQFHSHFNWRFPIYYPRLNEIVWVKYYDQDGNLQTLDPSQYRSQGLSESYGALWIPRTVIRPQTEWGNPFAVNIRYTTTSFNHGDLQHAVRLMVGEWFSQRANVSEIQPYKILSTSERLLQPLKVGGYL